MAEKNNKKEVEKEVPSEVNDWAGQEEASSKEQIKSKIKKSGNPEKLVKLRNRFFYMFYRYTSMLFITSAVCFAASLIFLLVFIQKPVPPQYIKVDREGRYIPLDSVSECRDAEEVKRFMLSAIKKMYKYDYINYPEQLNSAQEYFTQNGWDKYLEEFAKNKTLLAVKENKWIVTVEPTGIPVLEKEYKDERNGACVMNLKAPILISYIGNNGQSRKGDLYMRIQRQSVITSDHGLGVTQVVFQDEKK